MDNGKTSITSLYLVNPEKLSPHPLLTQYFPDGSDEERRDLKECKMWRLNTPPC